MINPLLCLDYPDPDVIRVDDTYYMVSTTMYYMPGCEILKSYDLINWEHAAYVYDRLDSTPAQCLEGDSNIYGKGMWAASLRYHKGTFYIVFVCNDTHKTYLYRSDDINGPWSKSYIEGFYHDCSLLFDDDRVYIVYGNRHIHLTELRSDLSGPLEGGINKIIIKDSDKAPLGYEGAHFYKINGKYYIFLIHSLCDRWMRTEACYVADKVDGEYTGGDVLVNDMGYCGSGVAQGGIVDTPNGCWYAILFQDRGAVGRIPVLVPVTWENDFPVLCNDIDILKNPSVTSTHPEYTYDILAGSDDFKTNSGPSFGHKSFWQFNHEPKLELTNLNTQAGTWSVTTDKICDDVTKAINTITQRMYFPGTHCEVSLDAGGLNEGDYAGLVSLQNAYAFVAVTKRDDKLYMVMHEKVIGKEVKQYEQAIELIDSPKVRLSFDADFNNMKDEVIFNIGPAHKMSFSLEHFTGNRAGLFIYSTKVTGGTAVFSDFVLKKIDM